MRRTWQQETLQFNVVTVFVGQDKADSRCHLRDTYIDYFILMIKKKEISSFVKTEALIKALQRQHRPLVVKQVTDAQQDGQKESETMFQPEFKGT